MRIDEKNFIEELKKKNPRALNYIIDIYGPLVKGIVTKTLYSLGDEGIIEECISDVFSALWENGHKFKGEDCKFKSWLGAVAKFKSIDYFRKYSKKKNIDIIDENITDGRSAEDSFMEYIENNRLVSIIESFEEPDRTIFIMKYLLGEKSKVISETLKLSVSNVNTRISRGKERLRRVYYKEVGEGVNHG